MTIICYKTRDGCFLDGMTKCPRWGGKQRPRVGVNAIYLVSICVSIRSIDCAPAARSPALLTADPTYSSSWPWTSWTLASTLTSSHLSSPHQVSHFCNRPAYGSKIENIKSLINIMNEALHKFLSSHIIRLFPTCLVDYSRLSGGVKDLCGETRSNWLLI